MAGVEYLKSKNHAEAYREFKAAYTATPTWKVLGNLGIAADELERDGEAIDSLEKYLADGSTELEAGEIKQVRRDIERLQSNVATVSFQAAGRLWIVDTRIEPNRTIINEYGPYDDRVELRVRSGKHEFALRSNDHSSSQTWVVTLHPGDNKAHTFASKERHIASDGGLIPTEAPLAPDELGTHQSHVASYVLWGTGAAAAVAATVFYVKARELQDEADTQFERSCPLGAAPSLGCEQTTSGDDKAAGWRTAALVAGLGALGALAGGTILYFVGASAEAEHDVPAEKASLQPWFTPDSVGLSGTF